MSDYIIRRSTGESMLIAEGSLDRSFSVALTGDEYRYYGHNIAQNFINLTGNFAGLVPPEQNLNIHYDSVTNAPPVSPNPLIGQLWYDTKNKLLKVYDGDSWDAVTSFIAAITKDVMPDENFDINIGSDINRWHSIYSTHLDVSSNSNGVPDPDAIPAISLDGIMTIRNTDATLSSSNRVGKIVPFIDGGVVSLADLGEPTAPFREIHTKSLVFDGKAGLKLINLSGNYYLVPSTTSTSSSNLHIGKKDNFFKSVSASEINADLLSAISDVISFDKTIMPYAGSVVNIGSSSNKVNAMFSGDVTTTYLKGGGTCTYALDKVPEIVAVTYGNINSGNAATSAAWQSFREINGGKFKTNFEPYYGEFNLHGSDRTDSRFSYNLISHNNALNDFNGGTYNIHSNCFRDSTGAFGNQGKILYGTANQSATVFNMYSGPSQNSTPSINLGVSHPRTSVAASEFDPVIFGGLMQLKHNSWYARILDTDGTAVSNGITMTSDKTVFVKEIEVPNIVLTSGGTITATSGTIGGKLLGSEGDASTLYIDSESSDSSFSIKGEKFIPVDTNTTDLGSAANVFDNGYIKTINSTSVNTTNLTTTGATSLPSVTTVGGTQLLTAGKITSSLMPLPPTATETAVGGLEIASLVEIITNDPSLTTQAITLGILSQAIKLPNAVAVPMVSSSGTATLSIGHIKLGGLLINFGRINTSGAGSGTVYDLDLTLGNGAGYSNSNYSFFATTQGSPFGYVNEDNGRTNTLVKVVQRKEGSAGVNPTFISFFTIGAA